MKLLIYLKSMEMAEERESICTYFKERLFYSLLFAYLKYLFLFNLLSCLFSGTLLAVMVPLLLQCVNIRYLYFIYARYAYAY